MHPHQGIGVRWLAIFASVVVLGATSIIGLYKWIDTGKPDPGPGFIKFLSVSAILTLTVSILSRGLASPQTTPIDAADSSHEAS
jgi:hypothetical protein